MLNGVLTSKRRCNLEEGWRSPGEGSSDEEDDVKAVAPAGRASAHNRKIYIESGRLSALDVSLAFLPSAFPSSGAAAPHPALCFHTYTQ